jgi:hypothetical protein
LYVFSCSIRIPVPFIFLFSHLHTITYYFVYRSTKILLGCRCSNMILRNIILLHKKSLLDMHLCNLICTIRKKITDLLCNFVALKSRSHLNGCSIFTINACVLPVHEKHPILRHYLCIHLLLLKPPRPLLFP